MTTLVGMGTSGLCVLIMLMLGAQLVPMGEIQARYGELDSRREIVAICHHGGRSMQVALFLEKNGFANVHNLSGGMEAWSTTVDPSVPRY